MRKQRYFFPKPGRVYNKVKTKYRRAVHRMSLKTFQAAQRIILRACLHGGGGPQVGEVTPLGEVKQ